MADELAYCKIRLGDDSWHAGVGWYYWDSEYPEEGSVGAFATREEALVHAMEAGYEAAES